MNNGLGFQLANVPTITGLASVQASDMTSDVVNTTQLLINGVDITLSLDDKVSKTFNNLVTGINTFNNAANVFWGDGAHLTGVVSAPPANMVTTNTVQSITSNKTMYGSTLTFDNGAGVNSTIRQQTITNSLDLVNNFNGGGFNLISKTGLGVIKAVSFDATFGLLCPIISVADDLGTPTTTRHYFAAPNYSIDNNDATGVIDLKLNSITALSINSTACTFTNPPLCTTLATTANQLTNKSYVDTAVTNLVTTNTIQTITGAKTMNNASNVLWGDGSNLTGLPSASNMMTTNTAQNVTAIKTILCNHNNYLKIDQDGTVSNNTLILQENTALDITNKSSIATTTTMICKNLTANTNLLSLINYHPNNYIYQMGDFLTCATFTTNSNFNMQIKAVRRFNMITTTNIGSNIVQITGSVSFNFGSNFDWGLNGSFGAGTYIVSYLFPNYTMSSVALISNVSVSLPYFAVYTNQNMTAAMLLNTTITINRAGSINLSCCNNALFATETDNNTLSISNDDVLVNGMLTLTHPIYSSPNGDAYTTVVNNVYPIGYCISFNETYRLITSGVAYVVSSGITLSSGVWMIVIYQRFVRGTGTVGANALTSVQLSLASGTGLLTPSIATVFPMVPGNTTAQWDYPMGTTTFVATKPSVIQCTHNTTMTVGTCSRSIGLIFTKIA